MTAYYYNEHDKNAAQWLRNLIDAGHIAPGVVDERSIEDVRPSDLRGFTQCHFFAGIGVWSHALRRAGWPDDRPVWTGSCPCQPFSSASKADGFDDERHLWPAWFELISQCEPVEVFGEQVSSKDGLAWFDLVRSDMESQDYAIGALSLCAAGVGAPHIRERTYFVAHASGIGFQRRLQGRTHPTREVFDGPSRRDGATRDWWRRFDIVDCKDGWKRPVEPGTFPLVDGAEARVVRVRAYGNAIVAPLAEEFIRAYLEATQGDGLE